MKALILKEIREGWNVVLFGGLLSVLVMLLYAFSPVLLHDWQTGVDFCDTLLVVLPPALGVAAGSVLFAREKAKGTLPLLLGLPLSRGRIWGAKVIAGLVLAALAVALLVIPVWLAIPRGFEGVSFAPFVLYVALWWFIGFALALLCSTLAERPFNALLVGLLGLIGLFVGAIWIVGGLGGSLLGSDPYLDISLWGLLTVPPLLLASALTLRHGELLFRRRKWALALPAAAITFALLFALTVGVARVATRYQRPGVKEIGTSTDSLSPGAPVIAVTTSAQPATLVELARYRGGYAGQNPFYRSRNLVLLDTRTGKEVLVQRTTQRGSAWSAVSKDGRYAAIIAPPEPLTWAWEGSSGEARRLQVWGVPNHRLLYQGLPQRAVGAKGPAEMAMSYLAAASWSPDGEWLAVVTYTGTPRFLLVMRPDASGAIGTPLVPSRQDLFAGYGYAWDPSGTAVYFLSEDLNLVRWMLPQGSKQTVWRPGRAPDHAFWQTGHVSVSPDGKWVAVSLQSVAHGATPNTTGVWQQVATVATDGSGATIAWEDDGPPSEGGPEFTWSADSKRLYFVVPDEEHHHKGGALPSKLLWWRVGDESARPAEGTGELFSPGLALSPKTGDLVVWRGRTYAFVTVDEQGRVAWASDAAVNEVMRTSEFLGLDADGRAVIQSYEKPSLSTLDLHTGGCKQIYP